MKRLATPNELIISNDCQIMILGTIPSVKSSEEKFYYMHPRNRFWQVLSNLLNVDLVNASIEKKKKILLQHKIALYDVINSCEIINSDDDKITNVSVNNIPEIIKGTQIKHLFLNGSTAYKLLIKHFPNLKPIATPLPSTSPKNAKMSLDDLLSYWKIILKFLS